MPSKFMWINFECATWYSGNQCRVSYVVCRHIDIDIDIDIDIRLGLFGRNDIQQKQKRNGEWFINPLIDFIDGMAADNTKAKAIQCNHKLNYAPLMHCINNNNNSSSTVRQEEENDRKKPEYQVYQLPRWPIWIPNDLIKKIHKWISDDKNQLMWNKFNNIILFVCHFPLKLIR